MRLLSEIQSRGGTLADESLTIANIGKIVPHPAQTCKMAQHESHLPQDEGHDLQTKNDEEKTTEFIAKIFPMEQCFHLPTSSRMPPTHERRAGG